MQKPWEPEKYTEEEVLEKTHSLRVAIRTRTKQFARELTRDKRNKGVSGRSRAARAADAGITLPRNPYG